MPTTVKWAVGLTWFHAGLGVLFTIIGPEWIIAFALAHAVVAIGLLRLRLWAWVGALALSAFTVIEALVMLRFEVSTALAVLILLLTPSGREAFLSGRRSAGPEAAT